jgi:hypothetical protein
VRVSSSERGVRMEVDVRWDCRAEQSDVCLVPVEFDVSENNSFDVINVMFKGRQVGILVSQKKFDQMLGSGEWECIDSF